jgi:hypothetical protein
MHYKKLADLFAFFLIEDDKHSSRFGKQLLLELDDLFAYACRLACICDFRVRFNCFDKEKDIAIMATQRRFFSML